MPWVAVADDDWTYFTYSHGGNEGDEQYSSAQEAFDWGNAYAENHRKRWGFRHAITVKRYVVSQMVEKVNPDA